jgi:hypothetical protein
VLRTKKEIRNFSGKETKEKGGLSRGHGGIKEKKKERKGTHKENKGNRKRQE